METIVVGVDGSEQGTEALRWAVDHAAPGDVVRAVYVWEAFHGARREVLSADELERRHRQGNHVVRDIVDDAVRDLDVDSISIEPVSYYGHPGRWMVRLSEEADLVVVGSRGLGGFAGLLLGSVSSYLAHHAHCSVVIVRTPTDRTDRDD